MHPNAEQDRLKTHEIADILEDPEAAIDFFESIDRARPKTFDPRFHQMRHHWEPDANGDHKENR